MSANLDKTRAIIRANRYMTLGTCSSDGPWTAPVAYVVDENYSFYWYSATDARHSRHIAQNPVVSAAIFDSHLQSDDVDGIQMLGRAKEVEQTDIKRVSEIYWQQSFPDPAIRQRWMRAVADFLPPSIQRFYRLDPTEIFKVDQAILHIDRRLLIDLKEL